MQRFMATWPPAAGLVGGACSAIGCIVLRTNSDVAEASSSERAGLRADDSAPANAAASRCIMTAGRDLLERSRCSQTAVS